MPYTGVGDSPARSVKCVRGPLPPQRSRFPRPHGRVGHGRRRHDDPAPGLSVRPEYECQCNRRTQALGCGWRVAETDIQGRPKTGWLCRAVESLVQRRRIDGAIACVRKPVVTGAPDGRASSAWRVMRTVFGHCCAGSRSSPWRAAGARCPVGSSLQPTLRPGAAG